MKVLIYSQEDLDLVLSLETQKYEEEIQRLKEDYMMLQIASDEVEEELQQRIDKAIEYIEENKRTYENNEYCFDDMMDDVMPLLDILKGSNKE